MTPSEMGAVIRSERKNQGLTQPELALICGSGIRFIVDAENGKETCQIGKVLHLLNCLGLDINVVPKKSNSKNTSPQTKDK